MTDLLGFLDDLDPDAYVGQRVDLYRRARKMQQKELALACGIHRVSLSRKINGTQPWSLSDLHGIANALGVSVSDLTEGVERARRDSNPKPSDP